MIARAPKSIFLFLLCFTAIGFSATQTDYSGTYTAQQKKKGKTSSSATTVLRVVQTEAAVEVTRTQGDKAVTNRFPLDGTEGDYISPGGVPGKGRAQLKDKYLVLESVVVTRPNPNGPLVRLHTRERWQLSSDSKTLTIKTEVDFPDFPSGITAIALPNNPWTETYQRTDNP